MKYLRLLLLPLSLIYGCITGLRNVFYNTGIFKRHSFCVPVIAVGNLSTGGTGKTPQTEYLIRLLSQQYNVAVLSRGYGRKTRGYILADGTATAQTIGDEPYQFFSKFKNIHVAVDANRVEGINNLLGLQPKPDVIILDDAYQHRKVKAGFYILLTAYDDIYAADFILPAGNLRESSLGAKRADVIVVTKCPKVLPEPTQHRIKQWLAPLPHQQVFFTAVDYDDFVYSAEGKMALGEIKNIPKILVAGIARPRPFYSHLLGTDNDGIKTYPDHHDFTDTEITELKQLSETKPIVTTEKDYMRLKGKLPAGRLFYLPIKSRFISGGDAFNQTILHYVEQSTGNR